jgi:C-3',4' desaturase CrtD
MSDRGKSKIIVIGAGIGGLTAGALLARRGYEVKVFEQAMVPGGCASTFKRRGFTFDVGATQVAGLENGGIHQRIFAELGLELPLSTPCDPACSVFLPLELEPINVWRDRDRWKEERIKQFPHSEGFWNLIDLLFAVSWRFQSRDPVLPPRNWWDVKELISALRLDTFIAAPFTWMTVGDALKLFGLDRDLRLKTFLDMQLKLYSQVNADETALLYAATALSVSQTPQGLSHLQGSMQVLSDRLVEGLEKYGGELSLGHQVESIHTDKGAIVGVTVRDCHGRVWQESTDDVVANLTAQNLVQMLDKVPVGYRTRVEKLPEGSGAFVLYLGVDRKAIPDRCPPHLQFLYDYTGQIAENNSLFVSVSKPGDGRAKEGEATIIASSFTDPKIWWQRSQEDYRKLKEQYTEEAISRLKSYFLLNSETILHREAATPRTFARYTARDKGIVGGIGQRISTFGPFGFATRTAIEGLWLVGDSTHPGEGTAGVSYSALTAVRQIVR